MAKTRPVIYQGVAAKPKKEELSDFEVMKRALLKSTSYKADVSEIERRMALKQAQLQGMENLVWHLVPLKAEMIRSRLVKVPDRDAAYYQEPVTNPALYESITKGIQERSVYTLTILDHVRNRQEAGVYLIGTAWYVHQLAGRIHGLPLFKLVYTDRIIRRGHIVLLKSDKCYDIWFKLVGVQVKPWLAVY
jgi:hypothetical protein